MKTPKNCPICANKLKSVRRLDSFRELMCKESPGHYLSYFISSEDETIKSLYIVLDDYSAIHILYNTKITLYYYNPSDATHFLSIPKVLILDFPSLSKLKQKLSTLRVFI